MTFDFKIKLINDDFLDKDGKILPEYKFKINHPTLKIQNSKFVGKPEDKFETMLFLPEGEERKDEGGLRTKGYFKFSYVWNNGSWWITDLEGNPVMPAPEEVQKSINEYINTLSSKNNLILNKLPLITVITVVLNGEKYLEQTIQSVINQTYPNIEYIIIDGGSTDGTLDIIKKYEDYIDYWVSEKDKGIYDAMNKGVICSLGKYLYFLGSDDVILTESVFSSIFIEKLNKIKNSKLIYGNVVFKENLEIYDGKFSTYKLCIRNICHQAIFYDLGLFKTKGLYSTKYKLWADHEINIRFWKNSHSTYFEKVISIYSKLGYSSTKIDKDFLNDHLKIIKVNLGSKYYFLILARKIIVKLLEKFRLKNMLKTFNN